MFSVFCLLTSAHAKPIIADLSNHRIEIDSNFKGMELLLFGARNDIGDIVVIVRSPKKNFTLRKKTKQGGMWINTQEVKLENSPDYYFVASSIPLEDMEYNDLKEKLNIGIDNIDFKVIEKKRVDDIDEFKKAFFRLKKNNKLYPEKEVEVSFMQDTLFKVKIPFPDTIYEGSYVAETYLLSDDRVTGVQFVPITIEKIGFGAFLYDAAHNYPALYGILAVITALSVGWLSAKLFK